MDPWMIRMDHRSADLSPAPLLDHQEVKGRLFDGPWVKKLSMSRMIENLYMVAVGIRESSMFHPVDENEIALVREAAEAIGVGMVVRKAGGNVYKVFIYGTSRTEMAEVVPDVDETLGDREFIIAQITIANFTGAFLDFPKCCVDSFIRHLMNATDQDAAAMEALLTCKEPDPRAYFVERFVPCTPLCQSAIRIGELLEEELGLLDPDLLPDYLKVREDHMTDVREGRIVEEKIKRDLLLGSERP